jgi:hypothetical protein
MPKNILTEKINNDIIIIEKEMKMNCFFRKNCGGSLLIVIFVVLCISCQSYRVAEERYQNDADIVRVHHFDHYAKLLTEYYEKTGKYPFQHEKDVPVYVFIMTNVQETKFKDTNPYKHTTVNDRYFFEELSIGLGRTIEEKYDPQKVAGDDRPNMYIYMVDGDNFYFAVHLYNSNVFTKSIGKYYHKMELANIDDGENKFYTYEALKNNPQYLHILNRVPENPVFFDNLDAEYVNNSNAGKLEFTEMYFSYDIANGETTLILYDIHSSPMYTSLYAHYFNTEHFSFSEEGFNDERGFMTYRLLQTAKAPSNINENIPALLSKILKRGIDVEYMQQGGMAKNAKQPWSISFNFDKNIYFATTNAEAFYRNENLSKILYVYDLEKNKMEFVLGYK